MRKNPVEERTIRSHCIQIEQKVFHIALKENRKGRFVRVTEQRNQCFATVMVPASGLAELGALLGSMLAALEQLPPPGPGKPGTAPEDPQG